MALNAEQILDSEDYTGEGIEEFQYRGGSPGGARPKIFTRFEDKEWMVKFRAKRDSKRIGVDEYNYSLLAKKCGIEMPETRLFEEKYFGVERFDRTPSGKLHVVSVAGLIGADYRLPSIDYTHIFQVCAVLTHSVAEMWKVYRLMVFNYLIDNKDDHAKNFAFIYRDGDWHFAPAYALSPGANNPCSARTLGVSPALKVRRMASIRSSSGICFRNFRTCFATRLVVQCSTIPL